MPAQGGGKIIPGTEGMNLQDLEQEVLNGGRFVVYSYCISVIILTFRRGTGVRFLRRGQDGVGSALGYSVLSSLLGWWGIPWGPIYTIGALITNFRGGKDVTAAMMAALVGEERAAQVMGARGKPASAGMGMMIFRAAMIAAPLAVLSPLVMGILTANELQKQREAEPGFSAYESVNDSIGANVTGGNTPEARKLAAQISASMKTLLVEIFEAKTGEGGEPRCPVWCDLHEGECLALMRITDLRQFDSLSKELIARSFWGLCQEQLNQSNLGKSGMKLTVGLRGFARYDAIMLGDYSGDPATDPRETLGHSAGIKRLAEAFSRTAHSRVPKLGN